MFVFSENKSGTWTWWILCLEYHDYLLVSIRWCELAARVKLGWREIAMHTKVFVWLRYMQQTQRCDDVCWKDVCLKCGGTIERSCWILCYLEWLRGFWMTLSLLESRLLSTGTIFGWKMGLYLAWGLMWWCCENAVWWLMMFILCLEWFTISLSVKLDEVIFWIMTLLVWQVW